MLILINIGIISFYISPTRKRAEGRAPVWGSEFSSKDAAVQGDPAETAAGLNKKLWTSVVVTGGCSELPGFWYSRSQSSIFIKLDLR